MASPAGQGETERLQLLYELSRRLATFTELEPLLRFATRRAREVLGAEGCALLLLDPARREFHFPVASQHESQRGVEARLAEIRFPASEGVAGAVLASGQATFVRDVQADPRFYAGVDRRTGVATRSILCAPLRAGKDVLGVIEVVNPSPSLDEAHAIAFLDALGDDIGVACEKARLCDGLRAEADDLRRFARYGGAILTVVGALLSMLALVGVVAAGLPPAAVLGRTGFWLAVLPLLSGVAVTLAARRRRVRA